MPTEGGPENRGNCRGLRQRESVCRGEGLPSSRVALWESGPGIVRSPNFSKESGNLCLKGNKSAANEKRF